MTVAPHMLGPLELAVMDAILELGESARVSTVVTRLRRPAAYTTVMTTLDRLHTKRLLQRRMIARAYYYSASAGMSVQTISLPDSAEIWVALTNEGEIKLITNPKEELAWNQGPPNGKPAGPSC